MVVVVVAEVEAAVALVTAAVRLSTARTGSIEQRLCISQRFLLVYYFSP